MNDHLHSAGLMKPLRNGDLTRKKIWEAVPTLFVSMIEIQELMAARSRSKTKVVITSSPGYSSMPPALQFLYAVLVLIKEGSGRRMLEAAPNR